MPDPTHPKTPTDEPKTDTTPKESIRPAQEEFVGDEARPSRDKSEYQQSDHGSQSSDRGVEDGQLPGSDQGSQSSDRAVEDASLSNVAADPTGPEGEDEDDDLEDEDDADDDELTDDDDDDEETEAAPTGSRALHGG